MFKAFSLAVANLRLSGLRTTLIITGLAIAITILATVFLLSSAFHDGITRNMRNVDLVAGAKGSPLQLVLSTIYQADIPTGNISGYEADLMAKDPRFVSVIPLTMGDSYKGWRLVGAAPAYLEQYNAELASGRLPEGAFEVVAGNRTKVSVGTKFSATHGFADGGHQHNDHQYEVVGVLKASGTVLDRLLITSNKAIQESHTDHSHQHDHGHDHHHDNHAHEHEEIGQVTSLLLKVKNPVALMNLPREINQNNNLQVVSPSYEMTRFSQSIGVGKNLFSYLGYGIGLIALVSLLMNLSSALTARQYDLAVLRVMGARPVVLAATIIWEAVLITLIGTIIGLIAAHILAAILAANIPLLANFMTPYHVLTLKMMDVWFVVAALVAGKLAGLFPAWLAAKTDIALLLNKR